MLEQLEDLALLGAYLASHEVTDLEADQIGRRVPSGTPDQLPVVDSLGDLEEPVDEPIEVVNDVGVQVVDNVDREYACSLLEPLHVAE